VSEPRERKCVTGADPDNRFPVPFDSQFDGREFKDAPELEDVARKLIARADELGDLAAYPPMFRCVWRAKAKKTKGKTVLGFCNKLSGLVRYYGATDWTIEVSADALRDIKASNFQVEALLFHELNHIEVVVDEDTGEASYKVRGEDAYAFVSEIKRYGAWKSDLDSVADAWDQAPLFATGKPSRTTNATLSANGRTVDLNDREAAAGLVRDVVRGVVRDAVAADIKDLVIAGAGK
jgi:hypothetical protein